MLARYSSKQGIISNTFSLSYSPVYRFTSFPSVLVSLSFSQCLLRQSTQRWKKSSVSYFCFLGLSLSVSRNMESASSMKASLCGGFLSSLWLSGITQPQLNGKLEQPMQLPFMNMLALLLSKNDGSKYFPPNISFFSGSSKLESTAILYTLQPSVWLQDSMSLVGSTFLPLLLFQKQSLCLFFMWRQSAGQLRYCFEQKHSYRGRSLLNLDCDRLRFQLFSWSWPECSPRSINQYNTTLQSPHPRRLDISINHAPQRKEKCSLC